MDRISHSADRCIPARRCAWTPRVDIRQPCTWCCNDKQCSARPAHPPHHSPEPSGFPPHLRGLAYNFLFIQNWVTSTFVCDYDCNGRCKHFCLDRLCYINGKASLRSEHAWLPRGSPCSAWIYCCARTQCTGSPRWPGSTAPGQPTLGLQQKRNKLLCSWY